MPETRIVIGTVIPGDPVPLLQKRVCGKAERFIQVGGV